MGGSEALQQVPTSRGQLQPNKASVACVGQAADQAGLRGAVDQLDCAVVAQEQVLGHVADSRRSGAVMAADGEEQLVLLPGHPRGLGLLLELTRDYNAILPLMLATVLADLLARRLVEHSIMTEKLATCWSRGWNRSRP